MEEGDEAIGGAALQLKGMAHGWWFKNYVSYFRESVKTYDEFTKGLVRKLIKITMKHHVSKPQTLCMHWKEP